MAQVWSKVKRWDQGMPGPLNVASGFRPTKRCCYSCTGPASSVQNGSTIDLSTDFTKVQQVHIGSNGTSNSNLYDYKYLEAASQAAATGKILAVRYSTGAKLSSNVDLSGQVLIIDVEGY